jgi:hypothetical protein
MFAMAVFAVVFAFYSLIDLVLLDGKIQVVINCIGAGLGAFFATHWYIHS